MYLKFQIQLKMVPACVSLERILCQELPLFEAGNIEVTTAYFSLKLFVNAACLSCLPSN